MKTNIETYKNRLIAALDVKLYEQLSKFLSEALFSDFTYKIFMSRKAFCILNAFRPVFYHEYGEKMDTIFKSVLNDRALLVHAYAFETNSTFLIVDDTMKFGRSTAKAVDTLVDALNVPVEHIELSVFAVLDTLERKGEEEITLERFPFARIENRQDQSFLCYNYSQVLNKSLDPGREIRFYDRVYFYPERIKRKLHHKFLEMVHAVGKSYSNYVPFFYLPYRDVASVNTCQRFKNYSVNDITLNTHNKHQVEALYCLDADTAIDNTPEVKGVRLIKCEDLATALVAPIVSFSTLQIDEAYKVFSKTYKFSALNDFWERLLVKASEQNLYGEISELIATTKHSLILYVYTYLLAHKFLRCVYPDKDAYGKIFDENGHYVGDSLQWMLDGKLFKQLKDVNIKSLTDIPGIFSINIGIAFENSDDVEFAETCIVKSLENNLVVTEEEMLANFFVDLGDVDNGRISRKSPFTVARLWQIINNAYAKIKNRTLTNDELYLFLIKIFELGIAGTLIKAKKNNNAWYTAMCTQEGEEADSVKFVSTYFNAPMLHLLEDLHCLIKKEEKPNTIQKRHIANLTECSRRFYIKNDEAIGIDKNKISKKYRCEKFFESHDFADSDATGPEKKQVVNNDEYSFFVRLAWLYKMYEGHIVDDIADFILLVKAYKDCIPDTSKSASEKESIQKFINYLM